MAKIGILYLKSNILIRLRNGCFRQNLISSVDTMLLFKNISHKLVTSSYFCIGTFMLTSIFRLKVFAALV